MADPFDTADFYGLDPMADHYHASTPWEAIDASGLSEEADDMPITVYALKCEEWPDADAIAEHLFEHLDETPLLEELRDPENPLDRKPLFLSALRHAAEVFRSEYKVWHCEQVGERTRTLAEWREVTRG